MAQKSNPKRKAKYAAQFAITAKNKERKRAKHKKLHPNDKKAK